MPQGRVGQGGHLTDWRILGVISKVIGDLKRVGTHIQVFWEGLSSCNTVSSYYDSDVLPCYRRTELPVQVYDEIKHAHNSLSLKLNLQSSHMQEANSAWKKIRQNAYDHLLSLTNTGLDWQQRSSLMKCCWLIAIVSVYSLGYDQKEILLIACVWTKYTANPQEICIQKR